MKNWLKGAFAAVALAAGSAGLYAQDAVSPSVPFYRTNDAIFATPKTIPFLRDQNISLRQYLGDMKDAQFYALDPLVVLKGKINYLNENGPQVRQYFTEDARQREIRFCQSLISQISKEKRDSNYADSLKRLEDKVSDGVITSEELRSKDSKGILEIEGNVTYAIGERNKSSDVPMLIYISNAKTAAEYIEEYNSLAKIYPEYLKLRGSLPQTTQPQTAESAPQVPVQQPTQNPPAQQYQQPQPQTPQANPQPAPQTAKAPVSTNDLELILDASTTGDSFGARAGLRWKVAGMFGLGFTASGMYGFPQTVSSSQTAPSPTGRYFTGSIVDDSRFRASLDLEASLGDKNLSAFVGVGPMVLIYNEKTSEELKDAYGNTVKGNYNSEMKLVPGVEGYAGFSIKGFRLAAGYDSSGKFFGELGISLPFNNPENKK